MKIYLDDDVEHRHTPEGWVRCLLPDEVYELLSFYDVEEISLDHDLGDDSRGTGYDVVLWIEREVVLHGYTPPKIKVHSANSSARVKMELGIESIERLSDVKSI